MAKPVPVPALPKEKDGVKGWMVFAVQDSGQLEKANNRITGLTEVFDICVRRPMEAKP